ncbi:MAG: sulfur carrier protein ThiS [Cellvibrionaceae bacterium]|nr:sulfur carrier protein ThiS [Cellvibrionaceae bacterium]
MNMSITVNGEAVELKELTSLDQFMRQHAQDGPTAVAVNGQFVPKSQYRETNIQAGDAIEIVAPMQGG